MRSVVAVALVLAACGSGHTLTPDEAKVVSEGARAFVKRDGGSVQSCNAQDHNNDGYVVCAAKTGVGDSIRLRCTYRATDRIGCKRA